MYNVHPDFENISWKNVCLGPRGIYPMGEWSRNLHHSHFRGKFTF